MEQQFVWPHLRRPDKSLVEHSGTAIYILAVGRRLGDYFMIDVETLSLLANYSAWADRVLFAAMAELPEDAVYKNTATLFGSMVGTMNHNYQVDLIWKAHLTGQEHGFTSRRDVLHARLEDLVRAQDEVDRWFIDWARSQTPATLSETLRFRFTSGQPARMQRGAMFLHVVNHKTYHRGWVSQMFFDHGAKPPETDLSVYVAEVATTGGDATDPLEKVGSRA